MDTRASASILKLCKTIYPHTYKNFTKEDTEVFINLWTEMFDEPNEVDLEAFKAVLSKKKDFAPSIADVKEKILEMTMSEAFMTEEEAWTKVKSCMSNYRASEMFETLPNILKSLVGNPNQLREWALMNRDQLDTVVKSNFVRSYKQKANAEREKLLMPTSAKLTEKKVQKAIREGQKALQEERRALNANKEG